MRPRTDRQTHRHTDRRAWPQYISRCVYTTHAKCNYIVSVCHSTKEDYIRENVSTNTGRPLRWNASYRLSKCVAIRQLSSTDFRRNRISCWSIFLKSTRDNEKRCDSYWATDAAGKVIERTANDRDLQKILHSELDTVPCSTRVCFTSLRDVLVNHNIHSEP